MPKQQQQDREIVRKKCFPRGRVIPVGKEGLDEQRAAFFFAFVPLYSVPMQ